VFRIVHFFIKSKIVVGHEERSFVVRYTSPVVIDLLEGRNGPDVPGMWTAIGNLHSKKFVTQK
jgi:hypothetical protein